MTDWEDKLARASLCCHRSQQPIVPGEDFYSSLALVDGAFVRQDYRAEHWTPADADASLGWWRHRLPVAIGQQGPRMVNHATLLGIFRGLSASTRRPEQCFAWMLALLLVRAKKLRYISLERGEDATWMLVEDRERREGLRIRDPRMGRDEEQRVLENLSAVFEMPAGLEAPEAV